MSAHPEPLSSPVPVAEAERHDDAPAVQALVLAAFGPGRFAKTAERVREASSIAAGFVVRRGTAILGSVRLWTIRIGDEDALFLGPIAVDAAARNAGLGQAMVEACVTWSRTAGASGILLVGDAPWFGRSGFVPVAGVSLPGPVDVGRLMWLSLDGSSPAGAVRGVRA
ncbi:N-acetyltransferase [Brevundimonas sp.]|uniref:GNAT family N-acetyltransferase n=1 Tax=Brevundimonas sp. TaxID=1871086 RepID=UPI002626B1E0|nr:N-acetyltransferase [Brevundimonas sp.]